MQGSFNSISKKSVGEFEKLPACTFVIPCLNEANSLPGVLKTIEKVRSRFQELEVILVDNGSSDDSAATASRFGVKIFFCAERGYGSAIRAGVFRASHAIVVFADADNTYDWTDSVDLVSSLLKQNLDLIVGNRYTDRLESSAMPLLNYYLGTPVLSFLITYFFGSKRGANVRDCNGGMRAFKRDSFVKWKTECSGMEFASEMIVRAILCGAHYAEIPVAYRRADPERKSHLNRWRDGARHIKAIFRIYLNQLSRSI